MLKYVLNPYKTKLSNQGSLWRRTFDFSFGCFIHYCQGLWIWLSFVGLLIVFWMTWFIKLYNLYRYHNPDQLSTHCVFVVLHIMMKIKILRTSFGNWWTEIIPLNTATLGNDSQPLVAIIRTRIESLDCVNNNDKRKIRWLWI